MHDLPHDWTQTKFREVCTVRQGLQIKISERLHEPGPDRYPYITIQHLNNPEEPAEYIEKPKKTVICREDDVLMTRTGNTGIVVTGVSGVFHNNFFLIDYDRTLLNRDFLVNYLNLDSVRQEIRLRAGTTTIPDLNHGEFYNVLLPLPPLTEQRNIAAILGTWDAAIATAERLVVAMRARKQALMQRLLIGEVRFPGFKGAWRTTKLGDVATVKRGASPRPIHDSKYFAEEGRAWVRIVDVTKEPTRYLKSASQYLSPLGESKSVKVETGELIMSICATIGVPKIVQIPACIHDGFVLIKEYEPSLQREFLYHYIGFITDQLAHSGQPGTQKNLNTSIVQNMVVPLITSEEQSKIVTLLNACEDEYMLVEKQLLALTQQKRGLMQRLLTGQVRVQVEETERSGV